VNPAERTLHHLKIQETRLYSKVHEENKN